jgi:hypothetical protein
MDWKEAAKWIGVLVAAGAISAVVEILLENHFKSTARAEARVEVDKIMTAALAQAQATAPTYPKAASAAGPVIDKRQPNYVLPQKEVGYAYQM